MFTGESSPPTSLEDIMQGFQNSGSPASEIKRPKCKVKVTRKGFSLFGKKEKSKKEYLPNCEKEKFVSFGQSGKVSVNCEGCKHSSDLCDANCRRYCGDIIGRAAARSLILDNGLYKREYGEEDCEKLRELYKIASSVNLNFPSECGLCASEHEKQLQKFRETIIRDPLKLLNGGIEVTENEDITVRGVEKEICEDCRHRTEDSVGKALLKLGDSKIAEGYTFSPLVRPFFSNSRVLFELPDKSKVESAYESNGAKVVLSSGEEECYSIFPSEYGLSKVMMEVLKEAYNNIIKKHCKDEKQFEEICKSEISMAASKKSIKLSEEDSIRMSEDLIRCTRGLDIIELLLRDPQLQDVYINSPIDSTPIYVKHQDYDDCRTNIYLSEETARNFISKFRLRSGRSFSEVSPILDMELPEWGVRVNITGPPISPDGLAFAFRRASEEPWTLLRFVENKMISPLAAGLLGTMVNEESTILMCGDRGSGKTSMLTALVGSMPIKNRILTMEDTFEIPVPAFAKKGFRIQRMRIKPSTAQDSHELSADEAMRSLLRMGDSAIVMGEVRGKEARTLYEAMNVGGSGNCVLGTIHGKSPRNLLERVVYSLGVPPQSFKATDLIVIADRIRPGGGSKKVRRVSEIVEVKKSWDEPIAEKVFAKLMRYDRESDMLVAGDILKTPEKSEVICKIAEKRGVKTKEVLDDIYARAGAYEHAVRLYGDRKDKNLLSMKTMIALNQKYSRLVDKSISEFGRANYGFVLDEITDWFDRYNEGRVEINLKDELRNDMQELWKPLQSRT
jgi:type IV secretory pathway ATPase VirB11/archaellum biosynthesis ATPase